VSRDFDVGSKVSPVGKFLEKNEDDANSKNTVSRLNKP